MSEKIALYGGEAMQQTQEQLLESRERFYKPVSLDNDPFFVAMTDAVTRSYTSNY